MDEELREALHLYFNVGLSHKEILHCIAHINRRIISIRTLRRYLRNMGLFRRKTKSDCLEVVLFLMQNIENGENHGYKLHHLNCIQKGYKVTQETVRHMLQIIDQKGVLLRKRNRLNRRLYYNIGPNFMWHVDSYDKLKPYGICINGAIDGFSRYIIWLDVYKTSSDPRIIGGYFLKSIKRKNGCPKRVRTDLGTENGTIKTIQERLRENNSSCFIYGSSNHNQRIESWWSFLRKHKSQFWIDFFQNLKDTNIFNGTFLDRNLIQFCFMTLIQTEMDDIVLIWNSHRIRESRNSIGPAGKPLMMYHLPHLFGAEDQLCAVDARKMPECEVLCTYKNFPCDVTVFELCTIFMEENNLELPTNAEDGKELYKRLRSFILNNI